ncbi:MAG: transglutaminaseTgpA domain-containing protein [Candidatus Nanopelagicales bacterium]
MPEPLVPGVLELRVHGVSGTPPHEMLGVPASDVGQVAGDRLTGLYRCRKGTPYGVTLPSFAAVEAYSWGALTSGAAGFLGWVRRAAWLTLLPFALGNLSYWARPELDVDTGTRKATAMVVRVACLLLTLLLIAGLCLVGIDLVAWQCFRGGAMVCPSLPSVLQFLDRPPWDSTTRRVLAGSLLPLSALGGLWFLSRQSMARYEEVVPQPVAQPQKSQILSRRRMWNGNDRTHRLQRLHLAAGAAVVVVSGSFPLADLGGTSHERGLALIGLLAALVVLLATVAVAMSYQDGIDFPGRLEEAGRGRKAASHAARFVGWGVVVLLAAYGYLLFTATTDESSDQAGPLRGHNLIVGVLLFVLLACVAWLVFASDRPWVALLIPLALLGISLGVFRRWWWPVAGLTLAVVVLGLWIQHRRSDPEADKPRAWHGAGAAVILGAAVWIAAIFTTSTTVLAADWFNGGGQSVADLQAGFREDASPGARAAQLQTDQPLLAASGPVAIERAAVSIDAKGVVTVWSGTLSVDALAAARAVEGVSHQVPGLDLAAGRVLVMDPPVRLLDSCVSAGSVSGETPICSDRAFGGSDTVGTSGEYVASGTLTPQGPVQIRATEPGGVHVGVVKVPQEPLIVPQVLVWLALAMPAWLLATIVTSLLCFLYFRRRARAAVVEQTMFDAVVGVFRRGSTKARLTAGFTHRAERLLGLFGAITSVTAVAVMIGASTGSPPWQGYEPLRSVAVIGLWTALGVSAGLIAVAARLQKSEGARRAVGVLWDLSTFWPRVAHPLGPPCYAERVVPEITSRIGWASGLGANVVLSGHSQGSLIAVAAVAQLGDDEVEKLRVVTYGSQLRTWYGRIFPGVLGPAVIGNHPLTHRAGFGSAAPDAPDTGGPDDPAPPGFPVAPGSLAARLAIGSVAPHWVNLFRRTDPIGFRVFSDQQCRVDRYVSEYSPGSAGDPAPSLQTHSRYQFADEYQGVVENWYREPGYSHGDVGKVCRIDFLVPD